MAEQNKPQKLQQQQRKHLRLRLQRQLQQPLLQPLSRPSLTVVLILKFIQTKKIRLTVVLDMFMLDTKKITKTFFVIPGTDIILYRRFKREKKIYFKLRVTNRLS